MGKGLQGAAAAHLAAGLAALLLPLAGCGPPGGAPGPSQAAQDSAQSVEQGYVAPPTLLSVDRDADGALNLAGRAQPGSRVRLATPAGQALFAAADRDGVWRLALPAAPAARMLGLSMSDGARLIQAQGYLFLTPDGAAARLRAGGGSERVGPAPTTLAATTIDYDTVFAATVSGYARADEAVTLRVDGVERGQANADRNGRFVVSVSQPLTAGPHQFDLFTAVDEAHFAVNLTAPAPLTAAPFEAERTGDGWRVDWLTPGGGEQSTVLLGAPVSTLGAFPGRASPAT